MGNYIGRSLDKISNIEILDNITFDGSSSYSITKGSASFTPNSAQSCLISIDGVVQATNFSVNSSNIDFGVAIPSTSVCNFFLHYGTGVMTVPSDGSVTTAKMFSGFKNGITELDQWRLTTDTNTGSNADVTSNWERVDSSGWGKIGTGLTESSGIFSFSQTGIYRIDFRAIFSGSTNDNTHALALKITLNNSSYTEVVGAYGGNIDSANIGSSSGSNVFFFDVTNISNNKFKFTTQSFDGSTYLVGNTNSSLTSFAIMRIGDT